MQDPGAAAVDRIPCLRQRLMSEVLQEQFSAAEQFFNLVSIEPDPPIQEVISAGVVPRFVLFLQSGALQYGAAQILASMARTTEGTRVLVEHGAVPIFIQILLSGNAGVGEQAVLALGNIAGDSPNIRDLVLESGGLTPILTVLRKSTRLSTLRYATWTLSNLCRGNPPPSFEWVSPALETLVILLTFEDDEVKADALWALSFLSDCPKYAPAVIQTGVCGTLVKLLDHSAESVQKPALQTVNFILSGDEHQIEAILQHGALPALAKFLLHSNIEFRKAGCWAMSLITAGNREQIQEVINNQIIPQVVSLLQESETRGTAMSVVSHVASGGSPQQVDCLVECGWIQSMADLLDVSDARLLAITLEALENILVVGKQRQQEQGLLKNPFALLVEQADGWRHIEALQAHENEEISQGARRILETNFA